MTEAARALRDVFGSDSEPEEQELDPQAGAGEGYAVEEAVEWEDAPEWRPAAVMARQTGAAAFRLALLGAQEALKSIDRTHLPTLRDWLATLQALQLPEGSQQAGHVRRRPLPPHLFPRLYSKRCRSRSGGGGNRS